MLHPVAPALVGQTDRAVEVGGAAGIALIAGPCVIESEERTLRIAAELSAIAQRLALPLIFKSSFDKANRTSLTAFRGIGMDRGLATLERVRAELGLPVTTDIHLPGQAAGVAQAVDLLQIPAFLCRQTDLLVAAASTGRPVNLKKGQFLSPSQVGPAIAKLVGSGAQGVIVTERGTTFGHQDLVVDMRGLPLIRQLGVPVCFDGTHSVQQPGAAGTSSGGRRELVPPLARAATGAGIDALFLEVHDNPDQALSDGPCQIPLEALEGILRPILAIDQATRAF